MTDGEAQGQIDALRDIDYRDELSRYFYSNNIHQQYALNLSGGSDRSAYRYSASFDRNTAHTKGNSFGRIVLRSEEHTSELQSLMRISYAVFCLKKQKDTTTSQQ